MGLAKPHFFRMAVAPLCLLGFALQLSACATRLPGHRSLNDTTYGYRIVDAPVRAGEASQRFEVRSGDCGEDPGWSDCDNDRERSEISLDNRWGYGTDRWIGFSVFLPMDFQTSAVVNTTVGQIHQTGGPSGMAGGLPSYPPLLQLEMKGGAYTANIHVLTGEASDVRDESRFFPLADLAEMRGRWTDILIHFDTAGGRQHLEFFVNGTKKAELADWIVFRPKAYYFKYGIYRSFVSRHGTPMPTQILYFDEVRMGGSRANAEVDPAHPVD